MVEAHSSHYCPSATQWIVIKYATYASAIHFLHNFEAQLNTFLCAEGLYSIQHGLITRAEGIVVGGGQRQWGGEAPHKDIVLNITKYLKCHIVLPRPQLVGFPTQSPVFIRRGFIFSCGKKAVHAASLALEWHCFSKAPLHCLCVSNEGWRFPIYFVVVVVGERDCSLLCLRWTSSSPRSSLPCPQACSDCGSPCRGMPSWLAVTGRIRQEMRVRLPCVGAYLGLSWGTNSKASLCSSRFEGTGNHLSALCITDNKGGKHWPTSANLKTLHSGDRQEKKRAFCVLRSVSFPSISLC